MRRESHVRSCESGRVRLPPATHQNLMSGSIGAAGRATTMARQNKHPFGKPMGLSLPDLPVTAEPAAYLTK